MKCFLSHRTAGLLLTSSLALVAPTVQAQTFTAGDIVISYSPTSLPR